MIGLKQTEYAAMIGKTPQAVERYVNGKRIPEPEAMVKIYETTGYQVDANSFYGLKPRPSNKPKRPRKG